MGQFAVVFAWLVPVTVPPLTIMMLLSRIYTEELLFPSARSMLTVIPFIVAPAGMAKLKPVATR